MKNSDVKDNKKQTNNSSNKENIKKKYTFLLILILSLILIIIGVLTKKPKEELYGGVELYNFVVEEESIYNCVKEDDCGAMANNYRTYKYNGDYPKLNELLESINEKTKKYQIDDQKVLTADEDECEKVKDKIKYRYMTSNWIDYYELDVRDIISIVIEREKKDYCTGESKIIDEVYNYSKKDDKVITDQDELLERYGYTKEKLNEIIVRYSKNNLQKDIDTSKITNYRLSYHFNGLLIVEYQLEGSDIWYLCKNE